MTDESPRERGAARTVPCAVCRTDISWQGRGARPELCAKCRNKAKYERHKSTGSASISDLDVAGVVRLVTGAEPEPPVTGPCTAAARRLAETYSTTTHPAAELMFEAIVTLALTLDETEGPTQQANVARELRGMITDLVSWDPPKEEERRDANPFGVPMSA